MLNVSEKMAATFDRKPRRMAVVMNCADKRFTEIVKFDIGHKFYDKTGNHDFLLVYTGNIIRKRGLEQVSAAIRNMENVLLMVAGVPTDNDFLNHLEQQKNIKYCGQLSFQEALSLEAMADVMIILYDPIVPNNRYANPNKLFEAMMFGIPVITNVAEEIVKESKCGILVEYRDIQQIEEAIVTLRKDPQLRRQLGENGRRAFEERYNWAVMERRLFDIYGTLSQKNL
jgi:glycosyltransferase involved in cell wall biosynthesis